MVVTLVVSSQFIYDYPGVGTLTPEIYESPLYVILFQEVMDLPKDTSYVKQ